MIRIDVTGVGGRNIRLSQLEKVPILGAVKIGNSVRS